LAEAADITAVRDRDTGTTAQVIAVLLPEAGVTGAAITAGIVGTMAVAKANRRQAIRRAAGHHRLAVRKEAGHRKQVIQDSLDSR